MVLLCLFNTMSCMSMQPYKAIIICFVLYRSQEIDMFGEISGVCFSPQADKFFVGIADATYSSLLQFNRHTYQSMRGGV